MGRGLAHIGSIRGVNDAAIVATGVLTYFTVRGFVQADPARAFANAARIANIEKASSIAWEHTVQATILGHDTLTALVNWIYIYGHWPVIIASLIALYHYHRERFRLLRNSIFVSGAIGFLFFFLLPVAPPRFVDPLTVDTITRYSHSYRVLQPPSLIDMYAAMPSLHAGWNLLVGIVLFISFSHLAVRAFATVMPAAMAFAVIATGNHYVLDAVVGAIVALMGLIVAIRLERHRPAILQEHGEFSRKLDGQREVRRRAPGG